MKLSIRVKHRKNYRAPVKNCFHFILTSAVHGGVKLCFSKIGIIILTSYLLFELQMSTHITHMDTDNSQGGRSI